MNNEPVAWRTHYPSGWEYKDGNPPFELKGNSQLLYINPVKELTLSPDEIFDIWDEHTDYDGNFITSIDDFVFAILRKAQEKC